MSDQLLIGERHLLFLDEAQEKGVERETGSAYPPLSSQERTVLSVVAHGLFLSESSIQWAYANYLKGDKRAFDRIMAILANKSVKLVVKG